MFTPMSRAIRMNDVNKYSERCTNYAIIIPAGRYVEDERFIRRKGINLS